MSPKYFLEKLMILSHRGFGTENEKKAAEIISSEYKKMGFEPKWQRFRVVKNSWFIHVFHFSIFALSASFLLAGNLLISVVLYFVGFFLYFEFHFDPTVIYKRIYPATSQNVYVDVFPLKRAKRTVVLLGHYDTAKRTVGILLLAKLFAKKLKLITSVDKKLPNFFRTPYLFSNFSVLLLFFAFFLTPFPFLQVVQTVICFFVIYNMILPSVFALHTAFSPFVPGAFDNGSGAAVVISLASYFQKERPNLTRLVFLNTGNEENKPNGIDEFVKNCALNKKETLFINLDGVGADKLVAAYGESKLNGLSRFYDKRLYSIVEETIEKEKRFSSVKKHFLPVGSDAGALVERGYRVMTTFLSLNKENHGYPDHYHQMTDTIDKINFSTMDFCRDFVIKLIEEIDLF